jgi:eukaryotic translation initiation factor 2C
MCIGVQELESMATSVLRAAQASRLLPQQVIYYRDGVSDSQFEQVKNLEVKQLRAAIKAVWPTGEWSSAPISCIIAKKRHHTRFFLRDGKENVGPGRFTYPHHRIVA